MYLDLLIIINMSMNYSLLLLIAKFVNRQTAWYRLLLGAITGMFPLLLLCFVSVSPVWTAMVLIITPFFMVGLAFYPLKGKEFLPMSGLLFLVSFVVCGLSEFILNVQLFDLTADKPVFLSWLLFVCFLISIFTRYFKAYLSDKYWQGFLKAKIQLTIDGNAHVIEGYLDTGNRVKEPFNQKPVIIASWQSLSKVIPSSVEQLLKSNLDPVSIMESIKDPSVLRRFYLIPFSGVGEERGLMLGFYPDNIQIVQEGQVKDLRTKVAVGIYKDDFEKVENFDALIPPEVLQMVG